jgi:hypothetical protein
MSTPSKEHIWQAFCSRYLIEHGTLKGVKVEFEWWSNPELTCVIQVVKGNDRCYAPCEFCRSQYKKKLTGG